MSTPYYQDDAVTLYLGDADGTAGGDAMLQEITGYDHVITDPPYNVSTRNGRDGTTVGTLKRADGTARKVQRNFGDWDHAWAPGPFLEAVEAGLPDGGSLIAFTSEFLIGDYMSTGLNHRNIIYWQKTNPTPASSRWPSGRSKALGGRGMPEATGRMCSQDRSFLGFGQPTVRVASTRRKSPCG